MILLTEALFFFSALGIICSFLGGPFFILIAFLVKKKKPVLLSDELPNLSIIIVARNAEDIVEKKINNTLALNYPADKREIIFYSDGSTDSTKLKAGQYKDDKFHVYSSKSHNGKINGMNHAVTVSSGDILVFTDVDVLLNRDSLLKLVPYFGDSSVGGVSSSKVITKDNNKLEYPQNIYMKWAALLKWMENTIGCITTNDGWFYAIRKELYWEVPPAVTDDLYVCLSIIRQNHRFTYNPDVKAFINAPSKDIKHELRRRVRIVSRSLRGIFLSREIFNPFKYGVVGISLFFNKILRRFLPIFMVVLLLSNIILFYGKSYMQILLALQCGFYFFAVLYATVLESIPKVPIITKIASVAFYFCLGNYGTLLGVISFTRGQQITKW